MQSAGNYYTCIGTEETPLLYSLVGYMDIPDWRSLKANVSTLDFSGGEDLYQHASKTEICHPYPPAMLPVSWPQRNMRVSPASCARRSWQAQHVCQGTTRPRVEPDRSTSKRQRIRPEAGAI